MFLRESGSLGEFYMPLVVDWVCYRFVTVNGVAYGQLDYRLELCRGTCSEV